MSVFQTAGLLNSLKLRITVGFVGSLILGMGLVAAVLLNRVEHDTLHDQTQRELSESVRTATLLSRNVVELQKALGVVAAQLDAATLADDAALMQFIENRPVLRGLFSNIFVATPDGQMRLFVDENDYKKVSFDVGDRDYFKRTVAESRPIISSPLPGRLSGMPVVVLTHPLRDAKGIYAVLCGGLRLSSRDLLANLVDAQENDEQALTVVTDASGIIIAHPDRSRLMKPITEEPRLSGAFATWQAAGGPVEPSGVQLRQAGEVVSAAGAAGPDWMVWRARPESELLAPLRSARREALPWAAGLIALMSTVTVLLLWALLRPLAQLEQRAQHLFDGVVPAQQGWPQVGGEIGRLAEVLKQVGVERVQMEASNSALLKRLGSVMSASPIGIAITRKQRFELVSAEFCRLFQRQETEFMNVGAALIYSSAEEHARAGEQVLQAFREGQPYSGEWQMVRADGSRFWANLRGRPVDSANPNAGTIWTVSDISDQKAAQDALQWRAGHDPLTGLANRREFEQRAAWLVDKLPASLPAAVIFIDLDHFKPINDLGGHAAGDAMLVAVAQAIAAAIRTTDLVARLGGDEFALLLERCPHATALRIAETVRAAVAAISLPWEGHNFTVSTSLGVASLEAHSPTVGAWLALADAACYEAKSAGRGVVRSATAKTPTTTSITATAKAVATTDQTPVNSVNS